MDSEAIDGDTTTAASGTRQRRDKRLARAWERLIVGMLPVVPRGVVRAVARRYVAGESIEDAIRTVDVLNAEGAMASVDVLGEEAAGPEAAVAATEEYLRLLDAIEQNGVDSNVSVKLTSLGLRIDESFCQKNLERIARRARELDSFVRIDMEDSTCTDATLRAYRALQPRLGNLGVVLQAKLRRTPDDIEGLLPLRSNVRLCKGIYREPPPLAYQEAAEVRRSFVACLDRLLEGGGYVGIATHDDVLVEAARQRVRHLGLSRDQYELQMLLGVRPRWRQGLLAEGHRLRVYVPYGPDWYAYSMRRLRENPDVAKQVMRALFHPG